MKFCKICGSPLERSKGPAKVTCHSCGGQTPAGYKFCQHCGTPLKASEPAAAPEAAAPAPAAAPVPAPAAPAAAAPADPTPAPAPAAAAPAAPAPAAAPAPESAQTKDSAKFDAVSGSIPDAKAAPISTTATPPAGVQAAAPPAAEPAPAPEPAAPAAAPAPAPKVLARLVSVNRDGSDGERHKITAESLDLGRTQGQIQFPDDPYLADRQCRFYRRGGSWMLEDLLSINGVYRRLTDAVEIEDGDWLLLGKQVLLFELLTDREQNLAPAMEQGVLVFGSPMGAPWGRLRQFTVAGIARDVFHLRRQEVQIGREDGDLLFTDDEFMSRRHLTITQGGGGKVVARDMGSSNGSFLRINEPVELRNGDLVRVGDQLLRFEFD
jgi:pSer/pThr/pTyr-binding forkhead associated (FHA) protein